MRKAVLPLTVLTASKRMTLTLLAASLVGMVVLFGVGIRSAETQTTPSYYKVQDLGTLVYGYPEPYSTPYGVNDFGHVVGETGWYSSFVGYGETYAFLYKDGQMKELGTLGGINSTARAINDSGQIVGTSDTANGEQHAFLYKDGQMKDLNTLMGINSAANSYAYDINASGHVVGCYDTDSGAQHAFLYKDAQMQDLGTLGGSGSCANAINDSGQVAGGSSYDSSGHYDAFRYSSGTMQDLGTLGGSYSSASGINASSQVVGNASYNSSGHYHAFLYRGEGPMQDLGVLASGENQVSWADDINDFDQVVGYSNNNDPNNTTYDTAFLYEKEEMIDLGTRLHPDNNGIVWNLDEAHGINNKSQIVAEGWRKEADGYTYTYSALLLTPTSDVPPPPDSEAPSPPTITSPQNNTYDSDGSFSVSGSAEAGSTVELFEGATSKGTTTADSSSGAWSITLSGISEGAHTYSAKAKDAAGNTSPASNTVTVTVDKTAPKVNTLTATSVTSTGVPLRKTDFKATFTEKMNTTTLNTSTFKLFKCSSTTSTTCTTQITNAPVTPSGDGLSATLNPFGGKSTSLQASTRYKVVVTTGAKDVAGNALDQDSSTTGNQQKVGYFTTGSS